MRSHCNNVTMAFLYQIQRGRENTPSERDMALPYQIWYTAGGGDTGSGRDSSVMFFSDVFSSRFTIPEFVPILRSNV